MTKIEYETLIKAYNVLAEFVDVYYVADIEDLEKAYTELENIANLLETKEARWKKNLK